MARFGAIARIAAWAIFANSGPLMGAAHGSSPGARYVCTTAWRWCFAVLIITERTRNGWRKSFAPTRSI
jgi:hypothetical protein